MNFPADESVDGPVEDRLRHDGPDVLSVAEMEPSLPDETVLAMANQRDALLLTADKDVGELGFCQRHVSAGVVLIRLVRSTLVSRSSPRALAGRMKPCPHLTGSPVTKPIR
jgi:predicted nuclease of predicted toxin-antitoxin system